MGRPKLQVKAPDRRLQMTLDSHPEWLSYEDVIHLLKLYRGHGFGRKRWVELTATGRIPAHQDTLSGREVFRWVEVKAVIDGAIQRQASRPTP